VHFFRQPTLLSAFKQAFKFLFLALDDFLVEIGLIRAVVVSNHHRVGQLKRVLAQ